MHGMIESLENRRLFAVNLLTNGDFESSQIGGGASGAGFTDYSAGSLVGSGWKVTTGAVDVLSNAPGFAFASAPAHGKQYVDMNGLQPGVISQTVATVAGHRYTLKFAYTATPFTAAASPVTRQLAVGVDGKTLAILSKSITGETPAHPGWTYASYLFTATGPSTTLTFASRSAGAAGMALDDVSLVQQPFGTGSISGQVFADGNGDGKKETDAIGLAGWTVFIDVDNNGRPNTYEYQTTTDHLGNFSLTGLADGTYKIRVVPKAGWTLTTPAIRTINVTGGEKVFSQMFGEKPI